MLCIVLAAFPYSADGKTTRMLAAGPDPVEIRDDLVEGLKAAHYVAPAGKAAKAPIPSAPAPKVEDGAPDPNAQAIEIPADWSAKEFGFFNLQALVLKLTGVKPANKADAVTAVEAEIARRAAQNT